MGQFVCWLEAQGQDSGSWGGTTLTTDARLGFLPPSQEVHTQRGNAKMCTPGIEFPALSAESVLFFVSPLPKMLLAVSFSLLTESHGLTTVLSNHG